MAPRLRSARNKTLRALDRMSLLAPVYRAYERVRSFRGTDDGEVDAGGLPVPPPRLRVEVAGTPGLEGVLDRGGGGGGGVGARRVACGFGGRGCASRLRGRPGSSGSSTAGGSRPRSSAPLPRGTACCSARPRRWSA